MSGKNLHPERWLHGLGRLLALVGGLAMVLMMLHIVADVALKYLLNDPIDGTTEIVAAYYMVAVVFLPLAFVELAEGHLEVELFTARLKGWRLRVLRVLTGLVTMAYLVFIIIFTVEEAVVRTEEGEAWEASVDLVAVWPSRWLLPVGFAAMAGLVAWYMVRHLRAARTEREQESA